MSQRNSRSLIGFVILAVGCSVAWAAYVAVAAQGPPVVSMPATRPTTLPATLPAVGMWPFARPPAPTRPATQPANLGPDVVVLRELAALYEPVPFDHKGHAKMAEMWDGCVTCHHRTPQAATRPSTQPGTAPVSPPATVLDHPDQATAAAIPSCKSCHAVNANVTDIRMPSLKAAYHRQCLNCHKEWMHDNACVICHKSRETVATTRGAPTRDDILGRMHPPIPEPETHAYRMRYTPADGANVLFRHKEHTAVFGLRCTNCHRNDNCSHCHDPNGDKTMKKPVRVGMTWAESHGPCMSCHQQDHCRYCHYKDGQQPPLLFTHAAKSGQELDKDHEKLACPQCHSMLKTQAPPTCGTAGCHKDATIAFPAKRPGHFATTRPVVAEKPKLGTTRPH
ncbi:MAG: cytochrome c3 family protein [Tepidisphaerales bacterium]